MADLTIPNIYIFKENLEIGGTGNNSAPSSVTDKF